MGGAHPLSLSSLLGILTPSCFCSPPGRDSAQSSGVSLIKDPRGETLEGLDGRGVGAEGVPWVMGTFEHVGLLSMSALP